MLVCIRKALLDIFDWEPSEMSELLKEKRKNLTGGDDTGSSRGKVGGLFSVEMQQWVLKWLLLSNIHVVPLTISRLHQQLKTTFRNINNFLIQISMQSLKWRLISMAQLKKWEDRIEIFYQLRHVLKYFFKNLSLKKDIFIYFINTKLLLCSMNYS